MSHYFQDLPPKLQSCGLEGLPSQETALLSTNDKYKQEGWDPPIPVISCQSVIQYAVHGSTRERKDPENFQAGLAASQSSVISNINAGRINN
jgi:hypothetical protein